jgi:hypothetical protein
MPEREHIVPQLLVITGLSGSGKTHVLRALEDLGWFCVDNLPSALVPRFAELIRASPELRRSALGLDVRERGFPRVFPRLLQALRPRLKASLLFLEADEKVLLRRWRSTSPRSRGSARSAWRCGRSARSPTRSSTPATSRCTSCASTCASATACASGASNSW